MGHFNHASGFLRVLLQGSAGASDTGNRVRRGKKKRQWRWPGGKEVWQTRDVLALVEDLPAGRGARQEKEASRERQHRLLHDPGRAVRRKGVSGAGDVWDRKRGGEPRTLQRQLQDRGAWGMCRGRAVARLRWAVPPFSLVQGRKASIHRDQRCSRVQGRHRQRGHCRMDYMDWAAGKASIKCDDECEVEISWNMNGSDQ